MPGMRVLQFGFCDRGAHIYLPHQYVENTVVYTGTHDNDTTLGWWREGATAEERANVQTYLHPIEQDGEIVWAMMRAAARSVAKSVHLSHAGHPAPGQRGADEYAGQPDGNWRWRYHGGCAQSGDGERSWRR